MDIRLFFTHTSQPSIMIDSARVLFRYVHFLPLILFIFLYFFAVKTLTHPASMWPFLFCPRQPCNDHLLPCCTLLRQGADVNAKDKDEISGLMEAAIMGHIDVVKELLKACFYGAHIYIYKYRDTSTPIVYFLPFGKYFALISYSRCLYSAADRGVCGRVPRPCFDANLFTFYNRSSLLRVESLASAIRCASVFVFVWGDRKCRDRRTLSVARRMHSKSKPSRLRL